MVKIRKLPDITEEEKTPVVTQLIEVVYYQTEVIHALRDEIAVLKGSKPRPQIHPGKIEKGTDDNKDKKPCEGKRPSSMKKSKDVMILETVTIAAVNVPDGSKFEGSKKYIVQGLSIKPKNVRYLMERWETMDGSYIDGELPPIVRGNFSGELISYILYQSYNCHVTWPLLLEGLHEFGIDISSGQIDRILVEGHEGFHREKDDILTTGLQVSSHINVDDTGARHNGRNGVCTYIDNELFAWFWSTESKSRINFLQLLRAGHNDYYVNQDALDYMEAQKLPKGQLQILKGDAVKTLCYKQQRDSHLKRLGITRDRHIQIATEGALLGSVLNHGFNPNMVLVSDNTGQFNILLHALCWTHAERTISKLVPFNENQRAALEMTSDNLWDFYAELKHYKKNPITAKLRILGVEYNASFNKPVFKES